MTATDDGPDDRMAAWPTGRLLSTAARLVEHAWVEALEKQGLTHAGLIALHLLEGGPLIQTELAKRARVENQTMSRTLERLEREGFVTRTADAADRRRLVVTRTPAGLRVWRLTRTLEAELFPAAGDQQALRAALLEIIHSTSDARWLNSLPRAESGSPRPPDRDPRSEMRRSRGGSGESR